MKLRSTFDIIFIFLSSPINTCKKLSFSNVKKFYFALKNEPLIELKQNVSSYLTHSTKKEIKEVNASLPPLINYHKKLFKNTKRPHHNKTKQISIIADLNLPQCKKYRVLQKIEILKRKNIPVNYSHWEDLPRCLDIIQLSSTVIFYRVPLNESINALIEECSRLKLRIGYDIDDPIFDNHVYSENANLNHLSIEEKNNLLNGSIKYLECIKRCDFVTVSTPKLCDLILSKVNLPTYIWRNLMDEQTLNAVDIAEYLCSDNKKKYFTIGYMSGSRAHEADFSQAYAALDSILKAYPKVALQIVGYAELSKKLKSRFPNRVSIISFQNYHEYMLSFKTIDLHIIPLVQDGFNDCKSAIRYLEASLMKTPTIVSSIGDFSNIIVHEKNGLLCKTNSSKEWKNLIEWSLKNENELNKIGLEAYQNTLESFTTRNYLSNQINAEIFSHALN